MTSPSAIRAGDSVAWSVSLPGHSSDDGWALKYRLLFPAGTAVDIATTAVADLYSVALTAANTSNWTAGNATLVSFLERGAGAGLERLTLDQAAVTILPDLHAAATLDNRSQAVKDLAAARAALTSYLANGQMHVAEYDIAGRVMKFRSTKDITDLIATLEIQVAKERALQALMSGGSPGRVLTRF
jgi:hypothetical protein